MLYKQKLTGDLRNGACPPMLLLGALQLLLCGQAWARLLQNERRGHVAPVGTDDITPTTGCEREASQLAQPHPSCQATTETS